MLLLTPGERPQGHRSGHSLFRRIRSLWDPLRGPGAPEALLPVPGKVCRRNKWNKGSRCWRGALSGCRPVSCLIRLPLAGWAPGTAPPCCPTGRPRAEDCAWGCRTRPNWATHFPSGAQPRGSPRQTQEALGHWAPFQLCDLSEHPPSSPCGVALWVETGAQGPNSESWA